MEKWLAVTALAMALGMAGDAYAARGGGSIPDLSAERGGGDIPDYSCEYKGGTTLCW